VHAKEQQQAGNEHRHGTDSSARWSGRTINTP